MSEKYLGTEECKELLSLGIEPENISSCTDDAKHVLEVSETVPRFDLQDILSKIDEPYEIYCHLKRTFVINCFLDDTGRIHQEVSDTLIDSAFRMLRWLKRNGF